MTERTTKAEAETWAQALESGKYVQTKHTLHMNGVDEGFSGSYCCLGVLICAAFDVTAPYEALEDPYGWITERLGHAQKLKFIQMNDQESKTFPEIAAFIRSDFIPTLED